MTKWCQHALEALLFLVIAAAGFSLTRQVLIIRAVEHAKAEIRQEQAAERENQQIEKLLQDLPQDKPNSENPFQFGLPPFAFDDKTMKMPRFTPPPPEPGTPAWYDSLPAIPECNLAGDNWQEPQCQRVSNYI
jgi:hypothetical protein